MIYGLNVEYQQLGQQQYFQLDVDRETFEHSDRSWCADFGLVCRLPGVVMAVDCRIDLAIRALHLERLHRQNRGRVGRLYLATSAFHIVDMWKS